ncbi:MAG: glycosyltransferase family 4 protein [Clostridia bacterium]|nr:glycosyltransferase family 4 protein [Clostridia bacterium]
MKILVICQYYYPEPFRITAICEELAGRGHEVTVVTGEPNYPEGVIYEGYEGHSRSDEILNGVTVHRCPIIPRKHGTLFRMLNYFSYPYLAKKYVKKLKASDGGDFDAVFVNQLSPVMMAEPATLYRKKHGTRVVLYCLDLWPDSLVAGGIRRDSPVFRLFRKISGRIYRSVDRILVTSRTFEDCLSDSFSIDKASISYLPQFADDLFERLPFNEPGETVNFLFAGNIGGIQSVNTVIEAASILKDEKVRFHIVGGGTDLDRIRSLAEGIDNVIVYGRRPLEEMPGFYAKADAMLVTLKRDPFISLTLPGKVQSYMAAGKPVIGAIDGETARVINESGCGFCGPAEDAEALAANLMRFVKSDAKAAFCDRSRAYYDRFFSKGAFMDRLEEELK